MTTLIAEACMFRLRTRPSIGADDCDHFLDPFVASSPRCFHLVERLKKRQAAELAGKNYFRRPAVHGPGKGAPLHSVVAAVLPPDDLIDGQEEFIKDTFTRCYRTQVSPLPADQWKSWCWEWDGTRTREQTGSPLMPTTAAPRLTAPFSCIMNNPANSQMFLFLWS